MASSIVTRSIAYQHARVQLEGYLAHPRSRTTRKKSPAVLVVPEWWGLNAYVKRRAEQLAELGYVAFAADMFGRGVVTTDAGEATALSTPFHGSPVLAQRARAGLEQLLATGLADPARVAAIGYCFGGSAVQALAYTGARLAGIVSFHGELIPVPAGAAAKTRAKILICQGAVDPFVPKADRDTFAAAMDQGKFDYQFISYAGAVHAFSNPGANQLARKNGLQGKIGYSPSADKRSWAQMQVFFFEIFAR
jgi:dienelactone hydrolase